MPSPRPVVLVTGASRGLGLSICKTLLDGSSTLSPANVISLSRTLTADLRALSSRPPKDGPHGATLHAIQGDVCEPAANQAAVNAALDHFGRLDALILNAGTISFEKISEMDPASFAHILQVNTVSLLTTIQAALPHLRSAKHGGKVVFVSSGAATGGTAGWAAYNASKAALNSLCRTLANEEPTIACWAVRPGVVDTEVSTPASPPPPSFFSSGVALS